MTRRAFITLVGGTAAWPLAARAQQGERMRRIGILMPYANGDAEFEARVRALRHELARLGWTEGVNVQFDERWTTDNMDRVRANAASLVASNPDVVVTVGGRVVPVLVQLSRSVPIVLPGQIDPVGLGLVESLARPGGNITGFTNLELSMFGKILETFKQLAPATTRLGLIYNPDNPLSGVFKRTIDDLADRDQSRRRVGGSCAPSLLAHPQRGRMAGQLETLAGVRDGRAIDFEDRYVLVEIVADQQIFSVGRERRPFRHTAHLDIADMGHLLTVDLQHR
jgi:hypothetical protein